MKQSGEIGGIGRKSIGDGRIEAEKNSQLPRCDEALRRSCGRSPHGNMLSKNGGNRLPSLPLNGMLSIFKPKCFAKFSTLQKDGRCNTGMPYFTVFFFA